MKKELRVSIYFTEEEEAAFRAWMRKHGICAGQVTYSAALKKLFTKTVSKTKTH